MYSIAIVLVKCWDKVDTTLYFTMPKVEPLGLRLELGTYCTGLFFLFVFRSFCLCFFFWLLLLLHAAFHSSVRAILYVIWPSLLIFVRRRGEGGGALCEGYPSPALSPPFVRDNPFSPVWLVSFNPVRDVYVAFATADVSSLQQTQWTGCFGCPRGVFQCTSPLRSGSDLASYVDVSSKSSSISIPHAPRLTSLLCPSGYAVPPKSYHNVTTIQLRTYFYPFALLCHDHYCGSPFAMAPSPSLPPPPNAFPCPLLILLAARKAPFRSNRR